MIDDLILLSRIVFVSYDHSLYWDVQCEENYKYSQMRQSPLKWRLSEVFEEKYYCIAEASELEVLSLYCLFLEEKDDRVTLLLTDELTSKNRMKTITKGNKHFSTKSANMSSVSRINSLPSGGCPLRIALIMLSFEPHSSYLVVNRTIK